jgi:hypothetical protein
MIGATGAGGVYGISGKVAISRQQFGYLLTPGVYFVVWGAGVRIYSALMTPPVTVNRVRARTAGRHRQPISVLAARVTAPPPEPADPSADFAEVVRANLDGTLLRYSQRLVLLKDAERRGIGRFEANLIIAAVLHRHGMAQEYELPPVPSRMEWLAPVLTFVCLQTAIVLGAWWVFR